LPIVLIAIQLIISEPTHAVSSMNSFVMCRSDGSQWPAKQQNTSSSSSSSSGIFCGDL